MLRLTSVGNTLRLSLVDLDAPQIGGAGPIAREQDASSVRQPLEQGIVGGMLDERRLAAPVYGEEEDVTLACVVPRLQAIASPSGEKRQSKTQSEASLGPQRAN